MANKKLPKSPSKRSASKKLRATKRPVKVADAATTRTAKRATASATAVGALRPLADLRRIWADVGKLGRLVQFRVSCVRPDDLLVCDFIFENLRLELNGEGAPKLVRKPDSSPFLIVEFPPQSFGEETLLDKTGEEVPADEVDPPPPDNPTKVFPETSPLVQPPKNTPTAVQDPFQGLTSIRIRMAGRSRIAFDMPAQETELGFNIEAILDACRRWKMRLDVNAVPDPPPFRVRRDPFGFRDLWFGSLLNSNEWKEAKTTLVNALGGGFEKKLAGAARRVSTRAVETVRSGQTRDAETTLHNAINEELDVLAERSTALRDANRRELAAAALSFMTTEELTKHRLGTSVLDLLDVLPFLKIIFLPHEPPYHVTALELPYRLILSPVRDSHWHHATKPVGKNGRTELWHTRLSGGEEKVGPDSPARVRALWSDDYHLKDIIDKVNNNRPFRMSLDPLDREMLVKLMAGFDELDKDGHVFHPHTAESRRLWLSSLGALLEAEGRWDPPVPPGVGLQQWRHVATLGRDHYVRVVYRGFLCKPRHAASLVKVTERKFESAPDLKHRAAVLRQKFFIVVRERHKHYDGTGHKFEGRNFSFTDVEMITKVTPTLLAPDNPKSQLTDPGRIIYNPGTTGGAKPKPLGVPHRACFWPMVDQNTNFMFEMVGTDHAGERKTFKMPLLFVGAEANEHWDPKIMEEIIKQYVAEPENPRRTAQMGGVSVCYVPMSGSSNGDTRFPTEAMVFNVASVNRDDVSTDEALFYPQVQYSDAGIAAMRRLLQQPNATVRVTYADAYNEHGFNPPNAGELFLQLINPFPLLFGSDVKSDNLGGLATPSMSIVGLSRLMGPVGGQGPASVTDIVNNQFNPAAFFQDAKILGGISLASILSTVPGLHNPEVPM